MDKKKDLETNYPWISLYRSSDKISDNKIEEGTGSCERTVDVTIPLSYDSKLPKFIGLDKHRVLSWQDVNTYFENTILW